MIPFLIREIQQSDQVGAIDLLQQLSSYLPDADRLDAIWDEFVTQPNIHCLVAVAGSQIIGYGSVCIETKMRGGSMGHVEEIVVDQSFRGQGVGRAIVSALIEQAQQAGCYKVSLECRQDNVEFYNCLGFSMTGCAMSALIQPLGAE